MVILKAWKCLDNLSLLGWAMQRDATTESFGGTLEQVIYGTFAQPVVFASLAILSVWIFKKKKINKLFLALVIVNILQDVVIFAARATLIKAILYIIISFLFLRKNTFSIKQTLSFTVILAALFIIIAFVTGERNVGTDWGIWETIVVYYIASFNLLDYYLQHPTFSQLTFSDWTYGSCILGGFYNFIPSALYVLYNVPYFGTDNIVTQITAQNVEVASNISMNAACTADYAFLKDFGYLGIIAGFALMARLLVKIKTSYEKAPTIGHSALYVFFIYEVFRLSGFYDFLFPSYVITFFLIWFLTRKGKNKVA